MLGHVDHGKTSLLDKIRSSSIASRESGKITQHIGASEIPSPIIKKICAPLLSKFHIKLVIPGLLFVDTPGHEAFTNLRRRGGSIADIAVLVIDITQGIQAQTREAIQILKEYKTPFVVAANKIDLLQGWNPQNTNSFLESIKSQSNKVEEELDQKIYKMVADLYAYGFSAERFDRISDPQKQINIVPVSAKTGEGIAELLTIMAGLAQRFLEQNLELHKSATGRSVVLEMREEKGIGKTIDAILYDGTIKQGDKIVFATLDGPKFSRVKILFRPLPLQEMMDKKKKFKEVEKVTAAAAIKIACENAEEALPGSPLLVVGNDEKQFYDEVEKDIAKVMFNSEQTGIIIKGDTIGSLEAVLKMSSSAHIPVRKAFVGAVSKQDVAEAASVEEKDPFLAVIFAFNVPPVAETIKEEAKKNKVKIIESSVIYKLFEDYEEWAKKKKELEKQKMLSNLTFPVEIEVIPNTCFRKNNPCIFGVRVVCGLLRKGISLMNEEGISIGVVKDIQINGESVAEVKKGGEAAISISGITFGKQVFENEHLYSDISREQTQLLLSKYNFALSEEEKELLKKIKKIKGYTIF